MKFLKKLTDFLFGSFATGKSMDAYGLRFIFIYMTIGQIALLCISMGVSDNFASFFAAESLSIIISLAAMMGGGLIGFLFGIPRKLQRQKISEDHAAEQRSFTDNTNLEEISDWLTKIIVGVGLIELTKILSRFSKLCRDLASGFSPDMKLEMAVIYTGGVMIFYAISGFLVAYLWTRTYLFDALTGKEVEAIKANVAKQSVDLEKYSIDLVKQSIQQLETKKNEFTKAMNRVADAEAKANVPFGQNKPGPPKFHNDCQKGRWGGTDKKDGYEIKAVVEKETDLSSNFKVEITVKNTNEAVISGNVFFFLHDSYYPQMVRKGAVVDNKSSISFSAYEAFTVGVYIESTDTMLELDLNTLEDAPAEFKYTDRLQTIDEITHDLEDLKVQLI